MDVDFFFAAPARCRRIASLPATRSAFIASRRSKYDDPFGTSLGRAVLGRSRVATAIVSVCVSIAAAAAAAAVVVVSAPPPPAWVKRSVSRTSHRSNVEREAKG